MTPINRQEVVRQASVAGFDAFLDAIAERVCQKMKEANEPEYVDAKEVARRLSRPLRSVHQMAKSGTIPSHRDGRRVMFRWAEVQRAVEALE